MLDEKIDGPPIAADEEIVELSQVSAQDPVSTLLGSVVAAVSADFDPACMMSSVFGPLLGIDGPDTQLRKKVEEWTEFEESYSKLQRRH